MKVREVTPHTGLIPIVIPLKLFLDLLRDPVFPRGLTDSQSHVPIFTNVHSSCNDSRRSRFTMKQKWRRMLRQTRTYILWKNVTC